MLAMLSGARIVRAHDVAPTVEAIRVFSAMGSRYGGS
jgi:dihydropteroate synthase